ncbi:hypothetical protein Y1Q_0010427 [Alligator mississippiensis]|uniref:Uncharacterized protein n=1 Tax=Alligator mississippiensis TaxID=8496 RepID=A0A151MV93_ALLMI|nr:hypothetical protein Y1Q_0010427 [Alligator mississippiensis]
MLRADFMNKILFEELQVNLKDLSCVVAFDNFRHWNITFWRREAYSAFWAQYAEVADKEELQRLCFETGQKYRERALYIKMYSDELEHEDMGRWLEGWVEKILDIQHVLDQWQIWTGAWKAKVVLEDLRHPGGLRHLPSLVSIEANCGYVMEEELSKGEGEETQISDPADMDLELVGDQGKEASSVKRKKERSAKPKKKRLEVEGGKVQETEGGVLEAAVGISGKMPVKEQKVEEGEGKESDSYLSSSAIDLLVMTTGMQKGGGDTSDLSSDTDDI